MRRFIYIFIILLGLLSCGTKQHAPEFDEKKMITAFHQGVRNHITGHYKEAIQNFEECLLINPKDDASHFALAQLYLIEGDAEKAAIHSEQAAKLDPKNNYYLSETAFMYSELGQYDNAAGAFEALIKNNPRDPNYYMGSIENFKKAKEYSKAIAMLNRFTTTLGNDPSLLFEKYRLYTAMGNSSKALEVLMEGRKLYADEPMFIATLVDNYLTSGKYDLAFDLLKDLVQKDPANGLAKMLLGEMYLDQKENQLGTKFLKEAIICEGPSIDEKMKILIGLQKVEGSTEELLQLCNYMTTRYPQEAKSYSIKGDVLLENKKNEAALSAYKQAIKIDPNLYPIWSQVLLLEFQSSSWDSLYVDSKKCIEAFPSIAFPYLTAGNAGNQLLLYKEAKDFLLQGLELANNNAVKAEILSQLGENAFAMKLNKDGVDYYEKALGISNNNISLNAAYAYHLVKENIDLAKAEKMVTTLLNENPNDSHIQALMGYINFKEKKYTEALNSLLAANQTNEQDPRTKEWLGDCYYFLNDQEKAKFNWLESKRLGNKSSNLLLKIATNKYHE